jgi:glycine dehydrogenase subunit 2
MKYNPRLNETLAHHKGFTHLHPYMPVELTQGALAIVYELERSLSDLTGLAETTTMPAAGAQGEFTALLMMRAYFQKHQQFHKKLMLIPDSAHGTNPASCSAAGFQVRSLKSDARGLLRAETVRAALSDDVAGIMITNPNTLGVFEREIRSIADLIHGVGGFVYGDGANMNALVGTLRPADFGVDVIHINLHKTFSTPHGGGGPGCGPVSVCEALVPFLPQPRIRKQGAGYCVAPAHPDCIGRVKLYFGQFLVQVRAWAYMTYLGIDGLRENAHHAVLSARYLQHKLKDVFPQPSPEPCMHEFVVSDAGLKETGIKTLDLAKTLMDYGYHPPTVYFPLVVPGAILIEPTESESLQELDRFVSVLKHLVHQARENPSVFEGRPHKTPLSRVDEAYAAKHLQVSE